MKKAIFGVAGAVLTFWLTTALYSWVTTNKTDTNTATATFNFEGRVIDAATHQLLQGAQVTLQIPSVTVPTEATDSLGTFLFTLDQGSKPANAKLLVQARGYTLYNQYLPVNSAGGYDPVEVSLQLEPNTPPATNLPVVVATRKDTDVKYVRRPINTAIRIMPAVKK